MVCRPDQRSMLLGELLKGIADSGSASRLLINAISMDSRDIQQTALFCAVVGATHHGLDYLKEVTEAGAVAVVAEVGGRWDRVSIADAAGRYGLPIILVEDLGRKVGQLASRFFASNDTSNLMMQLRFVALVRFFLRETFGAFYLYPPLRDKARRPRP